MLISAIITEVISEVGGDTTDTDLAAKMLIFAKGALRRFPLFAKARLLNIISYATLSAGENYLTTPTYFTDESQVWYEENGQRHIVRKKSQDVFSQVLNLSASGTPEYYFITGNVIQFDKNSDADRVIYIEHAAEVDNVTASSDFFGSTDMLEILKDGIKSTYYSDYVEDPIKGDKKLSLFKAGLDKLEERNMIQTMGGTLATKFDVTLYLIRGGTQRLLLANKIEVANGMIIVYVNSNVKAFPISNIKHYEFSSYEGD